MEYVNRIEIFKKLTIDDVELNMEKFECLLDPHYDDFVLFCNTIKNETDVVDISCFIIDSDIVFEVSKTDGPKVQYKF